MRRASLLWGILLLTAGILFLLSNLGLIEIDVWGIIWPVLMIGFGIILLWGVVSGRPKSETAVLPLEGARQARIRLRHGAGRLTVAAGAGAGEILAGSFGGGVNQNVQRSGDQLNASLQMPFPVFPFWGTSGATLDWDVRLNREVPLELEVDSGASESRLDLRDLQVTRLHLKTGASSNRVILPQSAGHTQTDVEAGAASLQVQIPQGVAARIRVSGGVSSIQVDTARFPRQGSGVFQSGDFDSAANRVDLRIDAGVGSIDVR